MIFLRGKTFNLETIEPDKFIDLLNAEYEGSQLHKLPILKPKDNDKNNLILGITIDVGSKESKLIGRVSLENIDYINQSAELKIFIDSSYQYKGYGKEVANLIINHGFNDLNLHRIYCGTLENNKGFIKLAKSVGFDEEGVRLKAVWKNNKWLDIIEYGMVRYECG